MKRLICLSIFVLSNSILAARGHKAHSHGEAKLNVAYDATTKTLALEFEGASEGVLGHEHALKTEAEKKDFEMVKTVWRKGVISGLEGHDCLLQEDAFELEMEGKHSEIEAKLSYKCAKDLSGQELELMLPKFFNEQNLSKKHHLNHLDVTILPSKANPYSLKSKSSVKLKL